MIEDDDVDTAVATEVAGGDAGSMASLLGEVAATAPWLAPGTLVGGQYRIERAAGAGAMGVVSLARDERLDRAVAIKLGGARSARALAQVEREAAALARLAHPNVVVVHQVGAHDGRVFLAMEYVDGGTARAWVAARPRDWRAIVALYGAAGDGLAAAHGAGLVHRDFKPDNVLVGADGRPRVADFGLVRDDDDDDRAIVGTPAYMPPEQRAGGAVDARADQYAFCASLAEALAAATPRRVPRHVAEALRRGRAADRDARWPSMAPLLAALRRDPAVRRRRAALVLAGAAVAAAIAIPIALHAARAPAPCNDGPAILAATWSPARATKIAAALGPRAWPVVQARVEAYARAWTLGHRAACRATRVDRSQSDDLLDRRMACLDSARAALDATLAVLERGGPAVAGQAAAAVGQLPEVAACADAPTLARYQALPTDPHARAVIVAADAQIAAAEAAVFERSDRARLAKAEHALAAARAAAWPAGMARALIVHATLLEEAGRSDDARAEYREASQHALASGHDEAAAVALADLAWNLARATHVDEAEVALGVARGLLARGLGRAAQRRVVGATATLAVERGRPDEELAARREMIAITDRDPDATPGQRASDQFNLAIAFANAGDYTESARLATHAVELAEAALGPGHPDVGKYLAHLGTVRLHLGEVEPAAAALERALAILESWYGLDDPRLDPALSGLGGVRRRQGRPAEAGALWLRRLAIARTTEPAAVPGIQNDLAMVRFDAGDLDGAAAASRDALAGLEAQFGPDSPSLCDPLILAGYVARAQGRLDQARAHFARSLALVEPTYGAQHPASLNARIELARTEVAAGRPAAARAALERRYDDAVHRGGYDPQLVVDGGLVLAELELAQRRAGPARRRAAAAFAAATPELAPMVGAWRAAHPGY